jgi:DNA primase
VYTWFARPGEGGKQFETGDVFNWLERYKGMEFKEGIEYVAQLAGVPLPAAPPRMVLKSLCY